MFDDGPVFEDTGAVFALFKNAAEVVIGVVVPMGAFPLAEEKFFTRLLTSAIWSLVSGTTENTTSENWPS